MTSLPIRVYVTIGSVVMLGALAARVPAASRPSQAPPEVQVTSASLSRGVRIEGTEPLTLERLADSTRLTTTVFVQSESSAPQSVDLAVHIVDADGNRIDAQPDPKTVLIQSAVTPVTIALEQRDKSSWNVRLPARGFLTLTTSRTSEDSLTAFREIRLVAPVPSALQSRIVWISLVVAIALVSGSWLQTRRRLSDRMGSPVWAESWGSALAVGAALLTSLLGITSFPTDTRFLPRSSYATLSVIFSALIAVSPAVYAFLRMPVPVVREDQPSVQHQGFVGIFLISAGLTVWATLGQLVTTFVAVRELGQSLVLSAISEGLVLVLLVALMMLASIHIFRSVSRLLRVTRQPAPEYALPLEDWPLL